MFLDKIPQVTEVIPAVAPRWAPLIWICPHCGAHNESNINLGQAGRGDECSVCGGVSFIIVEWVEPPAEPTEQVKAV